MSRPENSFRALLRPKKSPLGPQKVKNYPQNITLWLQKVKNHPKIESNLKVLIEWIIENEIC